MNCVEALRTASRKVANNDQRFLLRSAATLLQEAIKSFQAEPSLENMTELNGVWSYAARCMRLSGDATPEPEPKRSVA